MKTRWFKGLAAAAVAAFTFGFAPSAEAVQTIHWSGPMTSYQTDAERANNSRLVPNTRVALALVTDCNRIPARIGGFDVGSVLYDHGDYPFGKIIQLHYIMGDEEQSFTGWDVVFEEDPQEGYLAILVLNHETGETASYIVDEAKLLHSGDTEFNADYTGSGTLTGEGYNYPVKEAEGYEITVEETVGGYVWTDPEGSAAYGDEVTIYADPFQGFEVGSKRVFNTEYPSIEVEVQGDAFVMPDFPVTVSVLFNEPAKYGIAIMDPGTGGEVTTDPSEEAAADDTVKIFATPEEGYERDTMTVTKTGTSEQVKVTPTEEGGNFTMPACGVEVAVTFKKTATKYGITIDEEIQHGSVMADKEKAAKDEAVTLTVTPAAGYATSELKYFKTDDPSEEVEISGNTFTMPDYAVTVTATFEAQDQTITLATPKHGMVETEPAGSARTDETVTITTTPDPGYALKTISVAGTMTEPEVTMVEEGKTYTFVMPYEEVTVAATFEAAAVPHDIIIQYPEEGGVISADPETAKKGEKVTLNVTPWDHYLYVESSLQVMGDSGDPVETTRTSENEFTFVMPDENVSVSASFEGEPYQITVNTQGGTPMEPLNYRYSIGNTTELYLEQPEKEGYEFAGWSGDAQDPTASLPEGLSFQDPVLVVAAGTFGNKTIYAHWEATAYPIEIQDPEHGTIDVPESAQMGQEVTITTTPATGYERDTLTVTQTGGSQTVEVEPTATGGTFTMPAYGVTVAATFKKTVTPVEYLEPVYNTEGDPKSGIKEWKTGSVSEYTVVSDQTTWGVTGETNWYVVTNDVTIASRITCVGQVNLILADGAKLNAQAGITASTATEGYLGFTVYAQSEGETMGALVAIESVPEKHAGIGGFYDEAGGMMSCPGSNITINGGTVTAKGGENAEGNSGAGIGGGASGIGSNIVVNGGTVAATGGQYSAGIGGGQETGGSDITINGGTVTAVGGGRSAGIGGGYGNTGSGITINGGTVTAVGDCGAAAIGGGLVSVGSDISIANATLYLVSPALNYEDELVSADVIGSGFSSEESSSGVTIDASAKVFFNLTGVQNLDGSWIEPISPMPASFEGFTIMTPETAVERVLVSGMSALPGGQPLPFALTNAATEVTGTITVNDEKGVQFANKLLKLPHADSKLTLTAEDPVTPTVVVTPAEVANATAKVYTNGVEVALAGEPPSCNVYENQENTIIVYTANDGYAFEGGATTYTNNVDTSKNPATIVPGQAVPEAPVKVVAKIGDVYYETLPAAFGAVKSGETITMVGDVEDLAITTSPYLTLAKGKAVTFDLAGHRIYGETATKGNTVMLQVNGDLTVTDSSEGKTGYFGVKALNPSEVAAYGNYLLYIPNGSVTLEAGTLENLSEGPACYVFQMGGESNAVTVNGGTARAVSPVARMFYYSAAPTMNFTLNGGLLESTRSVGIQYFAYSVSGRSAITVTGGEIKADKYGIYAYGTDGGLNVDISGGTITTANKDYSAICLYNYRPQAFDEPTSVNITGGTVVGSQFLMEVYDYYGVTRTTISDGTFGGQIYLYTKDASRIDQCRLDNYCVQISGGTFKNFGLYEGSQAKVYWENFSGLSLIGGAYDARIATEPNPNGRVAEGYTYVWDEGRGLWLVVPGTIAGDVICEKGDETTIETAEKPAETKEQVWEAATNIVATAVTAEAPVIVADVELTNAVDQAKSEVPEGSTVIAVFAEVNLTITPKSALADDQDKVTAVTMNVTPSLMTWSVVDDGAGTITTNEVGEARNFEYSGKPMTVSFSVADMAYPPVQVVHRHSDDYAETYGRGELPSDTTFAYDAETQTITLMMRSFSDIEVYSAIQVGDTAYATIGADGTCTVSGTGDMWSFDDPTSAVLWGNHAAIRRVDIGEGVTSVGKNAFAFQKGVLTITIGGGVTNICEDAFFSCLNVTDLSVGAGVQTVGKSAFGRCNSLTDLSFGSKEVAEACQGKAFKIVARITMNGSTPVIDAVPKVTIAGYVRTLYGAETLAGPWEAIADETNIPAKYHFFKYEYNAEEK